MDDAITTLNNINDRRDRRGSTGSNESLNFRDSSFDPMAKTRKHDKNIPLIQPIAVDPYKELGKGLG